MDIVKTGSIAQDALRLGFQTTCNAGVVKLLKINDITIEACASFKERHLEEVKNRLINFVTKTEEYKRKDFIENMVRIANSLEYKFASAIPFITAYRLYNYKNIINKQNPRDFKVTDVKVSDPELDIIGGRWITTVTYKQTSSEWSGYFASTIVIFKKKEEVIVTVKITTDARKCIVKFIPYDEYSEKYIPDQVAELAYQAKEIGLKNLLIARPEITNTPAVSKDPLIVGHIGDQMYLIAMFGQDVKDHMSFNI
jgi:hypothetical protein